MIKRQSKESINKKDLGFNYEEFKKAKDPWEYIEEKVIKLTAKKLNIDESIVRLAAKQSHATNLLGHILGLVRRKKRVSVKKMAERLKTTEENIKNIESEKIKDFPLGQIADFLNELGYILDFNIQEFSKKRDIQDKDEI